MDTQEFEALYDRAHRAICPGDETLLILPSGDIIPHSARDLMAAIRDWFGHLAPVSTAISDAQMERLVGHTGDNTSFVFGGSDWRRAGTQPGQRRESGASDAWEKVA